MTKHAPDIVRRKAIEAAVALILQQGIEAYTLDNVVRHAAISKGGLLHHFRSKDDLSAALMRHCFEKFEARMAAHMAADAGPGRGRWLRAYTRATFEPAREEDALIRALFAITASTPQLLRRKRKVIAALTPARPHDGLPAETAEMVRLACDGLWVNEMIGWAKYTPAQRKRLCAALLKAAGGE